MPFSVIAVVMLVMVTVSGAYVYSIEHARMESISRKTSLAELDKTAGHVQTMLENQLYMLSLGEISNMVTGIEDAGTLNAADQDRLLRAVNEELRNGFEEYLDANFPTEVDGNRVEVLTRGSGDGSGSGSSSIEQDFSVYLMPGDYIANDLVPVDTIEYTSGVKVTEDYGTLYSEERTQTLGVRQTTTLDVYYIATGYIRVKISDPNSGLTTTKELRLSREIPSPYPLMRSSVEELGRSLQGPDTPAGRILSYILNSLGQFNALCMPWEDIDAQERAHPGIEPSELQHHILSETDVEVAVSLTLLMLLAQEFRDIDEGLVGALDSLVTQEYGAGSMSRLEGMLDEWRTARTIDPADIMFMYRRLEPRDIGIHEVLSRAIYANYQSSFSNLAGRVDVLKEFTRQFQVLYDEFIYPMCESRFRQEDFASVKVQGTTIETYLRRIGYDVLRSMLDLYQTLSWEEICGWIHDEFLPFLFTGLADRNCFDGGDEDLVFTVPELTIPVFPTGGHIVPGLPPTWATCWAEYVFAEQSLNEDIDFLCDVNRELWESLFEELLEAWDDYRQDYLNLLLDTIDDYILWTDLDLGFSPPLVAPYNNLVGPLDDLSELTSAGLERLNNRVKDPSWIDYFSTSLASMARGLFYAFIEDFFDARFDELQRYLEEDMEEYARSVEPDVNPHCVGCPTGDECPISRGFAETILLVMGSVFEETYLAFFMGFYHSEMASIRARIINNAWVRFNSVLEPRMRQSIEAQFASGVRTNFLDEARFQAISMMESIPAMEDFSDRKLVVGVDMVQPDLEMRRANQRIEDGALAEPKSERFSVSINDGKRLGSGLTVTLPESPDRWVGNHVFHTNYMSTPLLSTSNVNIKGSFKLAVSTESATLLGPEGYEPTSIVRQIPIDLDVPIALYTCWPLFRGVRYDLPIDHYKSLDRYLAFETDGLDPAVPALGSVVDAVCKLSELQTGSVTGTTAWSGADQKVLYDGLQALVDELRNIVDSDVPEDLEQAVVVFRDKTADPYGFDGLDTPLLGWGATLRLGDTDEGPPEPLYRDVLHILMDSDPMRATGHDRAIRFDLKLVEVDAGVLGTPRLDLLVDGVVELGDRVLEFHADPLMMCYPYSFQLDGQASDSLGDVAVSITLPYMEEYRQAGWKLSNLVDLPSVQVYSMGTSAHIDAGLTVTYEDVKGCELVINEFAMNGADGAQWVELYNPSKQSVSLNGMSLTNLRPTDGHDLGSGRAVHVKELGSGSVAARGFTVVQLDRGFLDMHDPDPSADGRDLSPSVGVRDGLQLVRVVSGELRVIDRTPSMSDPGSNAMTWQRAFDGSPRWVLAGSTSGRSNDPDFAARAGIEQDMLFGGVGDLIQFSIAKAFEDAYHVTMEGKAFELGSVTALMKDVLNRFRDRVLTTAGDVVHGVSVWFLAVPEGGPETGGIGHRYALTFEGAEDLAAAMSWTIESLPDLALHLESMFAPEAYPSLPSGALDGAMIYDEVLTQVPQPGIFADRMTGVDPRKQVATSMSPPRSTPGWGIEAAFRVEGNVPMQGRALMNQDWGDARARFGACVHGLPCEALGPYFGTSTRDWDDTAIAGGLADLWLMRGELRRLPG